MSAHASNERYVSQAQLERLADWSLRKPVIALMGEFSAGKSTLLNLLIGKDVLPTKVTATRMPPVWLSYGDKKPYRIDQNGKRHRVDLSKPEAIPMRSTRFVRIYVKADILKRCDLIDTPGISDPNIKAESWVRTVGYANAVMWCTHGGQAWRESERGAWEALPQRLRETSILLVTRKDKIKSDRDLAKIRNRLERETQHLFNARMFVSLTNAIRARKAGDAEAWTESGAEAFSDMLEQIVQGVTVQRSYMLTRYVVGTDAPVQPEAVEAEAETGNMLGFVEAADMDTTEAALGEANEVTDTEEVLPEAEAEAEEAPGGDTLMDWLTDVDEEDTELGAEQLGEDAAEDADPVPIEDEDTTGTPHEPTWKDGSKPSIFSTFYSTHSSEISARHDDPSSYHLNAETDAELAADDSSVTTAEAAQDDADDETDVKRRA